MVMKEPNFKREGVFGKIPFSATIIIVTLIAIYYIGLLFPVLNQTLIAHFAFKPDIIDMIPPGTFITYAFLHGNFGHLFFNIIWFLIFFKPIHAFYGSFVAYLIFFIGILAGSAVFYFIHDPLQPVTLIGASAGVSALSAAALRLILSPNRNFNNRPIPLKLSDFRFAGISAIIFILNILSGLFIPAGGETEQIAWQSHIAGYIAGAIAFSLVNIQET